MVKNLTRKEIQGDPEALRAIRREADALVAADTWLENTVCTKDELLHWSLQNKTPIHVGELLTICGIKHWETPELRKHKGRICYMGNCGKDEYGKAAVYQDLSSSPTSMFDANANLAYGCCPGNVTTAADAVRAYVQSLLKSLRETWVVIPYELWPKDGSWEKAGYSRAGNNRPCCKLKKALYGHPESGAHWERHLTDAILKVGGEKVSGHNSTFWFPRERQLLTVYVDDLLLSGPAASQLAVWKRLRGHVDTEDPEPVDRFLGRTHCVSPLAKPA